MEIKLDKAGFPMIKLDVVDAYIHWLPVTKVQLETFLCDAPSTRFDEKWYNDLLDLNKRASIKAAKEQNYWQVFASGVKPEEVQEYADWCGDGYSIPTMDEWKKIYQFGASQPAGEGLFAQAGLRERPLALITKLEDINKRIYRATLAQRKLSAQMFMRYGVMEWVQLENRSQEWGGMGQPDSNFQAVLRSPDLGIAETPRSPTTTRLHYYGFRLLWRP